MRIAIMLRTLDEHGGISVYTRNLVGHCWNRRQATTTCSCTAVPTIWARLDNMNRVSEHVLPGRSKAVWDQFTVPRACSRLKADVLLNPKFTLPLLSGPRA
jgi:hypothetical protein